MGVRMIDLKELFSEVMANVDEPDMIVTQQWVLYEIVWRSTDDLYKALKELYNLGARGKYLKPPVDWKWNRVPQ